MDAYYKELNRRYAAWYENYNHSSKIQINGDQLNFVENSEEAQQVLSMINAKLTKIRGS
ncbi:MAG: deoxynucleoside kinase [Tetragenococcus halophilus]|nr:deoxynucleoside kinase [Tetragenococcus halophilus]